MLSIEEGIRANCHKMMAGMRGLVVDALGLKPMTLTLLIHRLEILCDLAAISPRPRRDLAAACDPATSHSVTPEV